MAATMSNKKSLDLALFMEEVQKYDCLYNKFSTEWRQAQEKQLLESNWEKFDLSPDQAEKKVKNTTTGYGRFLKKSVPSDSGREVQL